MVVFTGPHGTSEDASQYESASLIASGFGVAAEIPYPRKTIYGYIILDKCHGAAVGRWSFGPFTLVACFGCF